MTTSLSENNIFHNDDHDYSSDYESSCSSFNSQDDNKSTKSEIDFGGGGGPDRRSHELVRRGPGGNTAAKTEQRSMTAKSTISHHLHLSQRSQSASIRSGIRARSSKGRSARTAASRPSRSRNRRRRSKMETISNETSNSILFDDVLNGGRNNMNVPEDQTQTIVLTPRHIKTDAPSKNAEIQATF